MRSIDMSEATKDNLPDISKVNSQDHETTFIENATYRGKHGFKGDEVEVALRQYVPDGPVEKKMLRKVDLFQLPMLWFMCVMSYVDRNNIVGLTKTSPELSHSDEILGQRGCCWHE